jgi:hypothetical protein
MQKIRCNFYVTGMSPYGLQIQSLEARYTAVPSEQEACCSKMLGWSLEGKYLQKLGEIELITVSRVLEFRKIIQRNILFSWWYSFRMEGFPGDYYIIHWLLMCCILISVKTTHDESDTSCAWHCSSAPRPRFVGWAPVWSTLLARASLLRLSPVWLAWTELLGELVEDLELASFGWVAIASSMQCKVSLMSRYIPGSVPNGDNEFVQ